LARSGSANAASFPIEETSITALHEAYLSGRATALSVCQAHLDRIAAYDRRGPALAAIIINNPNTLADAAALDAALVSTGKLIGPLHGIPVLVKDNYDVAGRRQAVRPRCWAGSRRLMPL
jgi:amidase